MQSRNQSPNIKAELTAIIFNLRHFISNYDMEIDHEIHLGSELPMLDTSHNFKVSKCYSLVRPAMPRDTFYVTFLKEQRTILLAALKSITIDSQFAGTKVRPPVEIEEFLDEDAAQDLNYSLPVDLDDAIYKDDSENPWNPSDALKELERLARDEP